MSFEPIFRSGRLLASPRLMLLVLTASALWARCVDGELNTVQNFPKVTVATTAAHGKRIRPFYTVHRESLFYHMAKRHNTDKVTMHQYELLYTRYLEALGPTQRLQPYKVLEIGLGCMMQYGVGHSATLWREYFPNAELWFGEFNAKCVKRYKHQLDAMNIRVVTGDQADEVTLRRWVDQTGGQFDIIIEDGGHSNMQQYNTFMVLMKEALKPGGIYFMEDLQVARWAHYIDGDRKHVTIEAIKDWLEGIVMSWSIQNETTGVLEPERGLKLHLETMQAPGSVPYLPKFTLPDRIQSIDCSAEMCAFVKCLADDPRCPYGLPQGPAEGQNATECGRHIKEALNARAIEPAAESQPAVSPPPRLKKRRPVRLKPSPRSILRGFTG